MKTSILSMLLVKKKVLQCVLLLISISVFSQDQIPYKHLDTTTLMMEVHYPESIDETKKYPAIVFFFGGGWNSGSINQFKPHARYFAKRGMISFLVDYRVKNRQQTTPFESVKDAKSAIRYIRTHANQLHVDTAKIVASGGSAGGHLAAATALIDKYNEQTDNLSISCKPNALVLFNPVIDNGPGGYGYERVGEAYKHFSPLHNITKGAPATIILIGTNDALIPVETVQYYQKVMEKVGSACKLSLYEGCGHGFFNYNQFDNFKSTLIEADAFLQSIGFLNKEPHVVIEK